MSGVWWLYLASLLAELTGLVLGGFDLKGKASSVAAFSKPIHPEPPLTFSEYSGAAVIHADQGLAHVVEYQRKVNNELIDSLVEYAAYSKAMDEELKKLSMAGDGFGRLGFAAALILAGAVLGGTANLLAASGS